MYKTSGITRKFFPFPHILGKTRKQEGGTYGKTKKGTAELRL